MAGFSFDWRGEIIKAEMERAQQRGLATAAADAVTIMQEVVPRDTGNLANSLRADNPKKEGKGYSIEVGSFTVNYALWVEVGTRRMAAQPYVRPAADKIGPKLGDYIKAEMP